MIKVSNVEIFNFEGAFRGLRNPMNSWDKSDSIFGADHYEFARENMTEVIAAWMDSEDDLMARLGQKPLDENVYNLVDSVLQFKFYSPNPVENVLSYLQFQFHQLEEKCRLNYPSFSLPCALKHRIPFLYP